MVVNGQFAHSASPRAGSSGPGRPPWAGIAIEGGNWVYMLTN